MGLRTCKVRQESLFVRRERHNLTWRNRIVAGTGQDVCVGSANFDLYFAKTSIKVGIGTAVRQSVARTDFGIYPLQAAGNVIGILYEVPARVF